MNVITELILYTMKVACNRGRDYLFNGQIKNRSQ